MNIHLYHKQMTMILDKLLSIESEVKSNIYKEQNRLISIKTFQLLLNQIDFDAEIVQFNNYEKLACLLISLKGRALTEEEFELLDRIIE